MNAESLLLNLIDKKDRSSQVNTIAEFILDAMNKKKPEDAIAGSEIFNYYEELCAQNTSLPIIPQNTFILYLSRLADSEKSKLNCQGKKQGYYIDLLFEEIEETVKEQNKHISEESIDEGHKDHLLEKDTYPFLENWLFQYDNERVADISSSRSQGKWANPDLVGIKTDNLFGATDVEITTIEAKITFENWEQWIFEAIAHTVFSNRSYFAFVHSDSHINKLPNDIKHYAEIFKIGVLIIAVSADDFIKVQKKEPFKLSNDNHRILEYVPAPYNVPHLKFKKRFLSGLGINEPKQLYQFGKVLDK